MLRFLSCLHVHLSANLLFLSSVCRIVFSAHTPGFCDHLHPNGTREVTVPAMTWNAGDNPGFVVATFHRNRRPETVSYCSLAGESQIVIAYISFMVLFVSAMLLAKPPIVRCSRRWFNTHSCIVTYILMVFFLYNWVIFHWLEMLGRIKSYCSIFFGKSLEFLVKNLWGCSCLWCS